MSAKRILWAILLTPAAVCPQQLNETSWNRLNTVRAGQQIVVTSTRQTVSTGKFVSFTDKEISLIVGNAATSIPRDQVVSVRHKSRRLLNFLTGLAAGAAAGILLGIGVNATSEDSGPVVAAMVAPIVAGGAIGTAWPTGKMI